MSKHDLSNKPKDLKPTSDKPDVSAWFYEEPKGLEIVVMVDPHTYIIIPITWRTLIASVKRYTRA